jgi:hypothetical protein
MQAWSIFVKEEFRIENLIKMFKEIKKLEIRLFLLNVQYYNNI